MTEAECNRARESGLWVARLKRKAEYEIEKKRQTERALERDCPFCEKKRIERLEREEQEKKDWYNSLSRIQQILTKNRGEVPSYF